MVDILIAASIVIVALCAVLVLFRIEARQYRKSLLKPASYKFGFLGMVVYLVMYGVLTIIEKVCFVIGKIPAKTGGDVQKEQAYDNWCFFRTGTFFPDIKDLDKRNWPS